MDLQQLANYFGGLLSQLLEFDNPTIPPKIEQLIECLNTHRVPSDDLIRYSSSPNLWPGMTFDNNGLLQAVRDQRKGFIEWYKTWNHLDNQTLYDILIEVAKCGHLNILDLFNYTNFNYNKIYQQKCLEYMRSYSSRYEWVPVLDEYKCKINPLNQALLYNNPHVVNWCKERHPEMVRINVNVLTAYICPTDNIEMFKWAVQYAEEVLDNFFTRENIWAWACHHASKNIITWLRTNYPTDPKPSTLRCIQGKGNLDNIKWLLQQWPEDIFGDNENALVKACSFNNIELVRWIIEQRGGTINNVNDIFLFNACGQNYHDVLKIILESCPSLREDQPTLERQFIRACQCGSLDCAKILQTYLNTMPVFEIGAALYYDDFSTSRGFNPDMIKWLMDLGYQFTSTDFMPYLIKPEHWQFMLDLYPSIDFTTYVQEAFENNCKDNNLGILQWLWEKWSDIIMIDTELFDTICKYKNQEVAEFLYQCSN